MGFVETLVLLSNTRVVLSVLMSSKADVWQGTLALMVLKTLERPVRCTATGSLGKSNGQALICCRSITARSTRLCSSSNRRDTLLPNGGYRTTIGRRSFTNSPEQAENRSKEKPRNGSKLRPSSLVF